MHKEYILMGGMALGEHWIQFTHLVHHIIVQPGSTHKAMVSEGGDSIGFSH